MFEAESLYDWQGKDVIDAVGGTIGSFDAIYVDAETTAPSFVSIKLAGLSRRRVVLVPLSGITVAPDYIRVPFDKSAVKRGPSFRTGVELTPYDERRLFEHYGMTYDDMTCDRFAHDGETVTARRLLRQSTPHDERGTACRAPLGNLAMGIGHVDRVQRPYLGGAGLRASHRNHRSPGDRRTTRP